MPQIIIKIRCNKIKKVKCICVIKTNKRCPRRRRRIRRKKSNKYKTLYIVNRIKINYLYGYPKHPSICVRPIVKRYFFVVPYDINLADRNVIMSNRFVDDSGKLITEFHDFGQEGYFNLYVNGVLQEGEMYRVQPNAITLVAMEGHIAKGIPIIIESVGFTAKIIFKQKKMDI